MSPEETTHRTACTRDCPDACGLVATVRDGQVVRLRGDREHPVTRGFLCERTSRFLDRQHDPDRLVQPLVRQRGELRPASWDEALGLIADRMMAIRAESGAAAILNYRSGGSLGLMKHVTDYFFETFGPVTIKTGDICSGAGDVAQMTDFGEEDAHDLFDLLSSRTIILWGKNPHVSNVHLLPVLQDARRQGARLLLVDPVHHRGADMASAHVQVRPGGDIALALGVARRLFERGAITDRALATCDHVETFRAEAFAREVGDWARLADVTEAEVDLLATALADPPCAILVGWGMQRRARGSATVRALDALGALSGNLGIPGGGVSFYFKRRGAFDLSFVRGEAVAPRTLLEPLLGEQILAAKDPPIRMAFITCGNPVVMLPDSTTVRDALAGLEMTVVVDAFLTDTARTAHVVLPGTTMLEEDDLVGAYGHHWLAAVRPVAPRPRAAGGGDGPRSDLEIVQELARRTGCGEALAGDAATWQRRLLARVADRGASLEELHRGAVRNPLAPRVLFDDGIPTRSGRVNLVRGLDPTPTPTTPERPLLLMAQSTEKAQGSQVAARTQEGPAEAIVHPDAAGGCADGGLARLESEIGSLVVRLRFDPRQRRDVVLMQKGGWLSAGRAANAIIPARATDAGGGAAYLDTPVRVMPA